MKHKNKCPRQLSLVVVKKDVGEYVTQYEWFNDQPLVYLGEIPNMPSHGVFIGMSNKIYSRHHIDLFEEFVDE